MRAIIVWMSILLCGVAVIGAKEKGPENRPEEKTRYRLGKAPKPEFKAGGKSYKIDPNAAEAKRVRSMKPEEFDPLRRRERVDEFYRRIFRDRFEEYRRRRRIHAGPFRSEFIYWTYDWPVALRARWAWHHRHYFDEALWAEWMANREFSVQINILQTQNVPAQVGYLPPEYASTSPVAIYDDEYLNAVYNPVPFLAVMNLESLKPDPQNSWIGKAAADSLTAKLSTIPGMFLSEPDQVRLALGTQTAAQRVDLTEPSHAAQVGKTLDVQQIVVGSYVADGDKVLFNLRMVDVETGRVINGLSTAVPRDKLLDALPELASSMAGWLNKQSPDGTPATPETPIASVPAPATPGTVLSGGATTAKHLFGADEKYPGNLSFTAADGPYQISDKLSAADGAKKYTINIGPGAEIRSGQLFFGRGGGHMEISGPPDRPAIFRGVELDQALGGSVTAHYAIFDNCKFRKMGAYYSRTGLSSKWELDHCLIRGSSTFKDLSHVDYGFKFSDCTFSDVTFPEIGLPTKEQPVEMMHHLRANWNELDRCRFDSCIITPTVFWCAQSSNYARCKFIPGRAFESDTPTEVRAFVSDTTGDSPDKVQAGNPPTRAAVHITYAPQAFEVYLFRY
jgi:TolB-like protein